MTRQQLGSDDEIALLVQKIKGFDFEDASLNELQSVIIAIKVLSDDIVIRQEECRRLQQELRQRITISEVVKEMADVVRSVRNAKPSSKISWFSNFSK